MSFQPSHASSTAARSARDGKSSDGVGVTVVVPRSWFLTEAGFALPARKPSGIGVLFLADFYAD
ncbi:MAG: hypothetical protein WBF42_01610 [Terracidiphilus sp.]